MTLQELLNEIGEYIDKSKFGLSSPDNDVEFLTNDVRFITNDGKHSLSNPEIIINNNGELTFTFDLSKHY